MKKTLVTLACMLALALAASAQSVNFGALPAVSSPTLLPKGYDSLDWVNFYYVDPSWSGAGAGFREGPNSLDVAFMGGGLCELTAVSCSASISQNAVGASPASAFSPQSAIVAAGYHPEAINVSAYNQGSFVGSQRYNLTTSLQQIDFPANWGEITQLVIDATKGTVVLYALNMRLVSPLAEPDVMMSSPPLTPPIKIGPNAPTRVIDPLTAVAEDRVNASASPTGITVGANAHPNRGPSADLKSQSTATAGGAIGSHAAPVPSAEVKAKSGPTSGGAIGSHAAPVPSAELKATATAVGASASKKAGHAAE